MTRSPWGRPLRSSALALAAVAALGLSACGGGGGESSSSGGDDLNLVNPGKLSVCSATPYEPFEFEKDGKVVGYDMDVANQLAQDMGLELNLVNVQFDTISSGLFKTQCDVAISSVSITKPREENMDFSTPYLDDSLSLYAKDGSGVTDLKTASDKGLAVATATTGDEYAKKEGVKTTNFDDTGLMVQALTSGQANAALGNTSVLRYQLKDKPEFKDVKQFKTGEKVAVAISKGNTALKDKVDEGIKKMESDGQLDKFKKTWFGTAD